MRKSVASLIIAVFISAIVQVHAHCQVPCGIFDDLMRIHMMEEHVVTIEKAMKQITANENQHQTARWIMNKEKHAEELTDIVTYYFMAQRIKPETEQYTAKLQTLHQIMIHAMKAKQSTDLEHVKKLNELIHAFEHMHLGDQETHEH